jgi:serine/threonine protein kinase
MVSQSPDSSGPPTAEESSRDEELVRQIRSATGLEEETTLRRRLQEQTREQFEILETLGHGGSGVVFKARDLKLHRFVAIKCLAKLVGPDRIAPVLQEARFLATINHPNVASIFGVSESSDFPFIVMEFIDGIPITDAMNGASVPQQLEVFSDLLRGVAELHRRNLVHRDLKPGNVLVDRQRRVKALDLGIAQLADSGLPRELHGTPGYLAPEQKLGEPARATADVFSLGVILFELLTGQRPFGGRTNPPLPRSIREEIPGAAQAICLTALEKDPSLRYPSAAEFLQDLDRFSNGESVWANPTLLASALDHGIERHEGDIQRWQKDRLITVRECDYLLDKYGRLRQREEFWILDSRRISFSQVMLHLGCWTCVVAAFLMLAFPWENIGIARPILPALVLSTLILSGGLLWRRHNRRTAIVLLMGGTITLPVAVGTVLVYFHRLTGGNRDDDVLRGLLTDRQFVVAALAWFAASMLLWRRTGTAAFAIFTGLSALAVATAAFGLCGLVRQWRDHHIDTIAGWYLAPAVIFLAMAVTWDVRFRRPAFAAPFYVMGLSVLLISLTLIAWFGPTLEWLHWLRATDDASREDQIKFSFIINGALYLLAGLVADRLGGTSSLRRIGAFLFWIAPSHLLAPLLRLEDHWPIAESSWTVAEVLLPVGALTFVFASVPKQMKPFFFSGMLYAAISVQRMTARHFEDQFAWPVSLAILGMAMALIAWRWPGLLDRNAGQAGHELTATSAMPEHRV